MGLERDSIPGLPDTPASIPSPMGGSMPALENTYEAWSDLTNSLEVVLNLCLRMAQHEQPSDESEASNPTLLTQVRQGMLQATQLEARLGHGRSIGVRELLDQPGVQLARAYGAAFESVGVVALLLNDLPEKRLPANMAPFAALLIDLAQIAAHAVHEQLDLVFGRRRLGTITNMHAYIASLENQADDIFRTRVDAVLSRGRGADERGGAGTRQSGEWPQQTAQLLRMLVALEALTDRCEDIADALLFVKYVL